MGDAVLGHSSKRLIISAYSRLLAILLWHPQGWILYPSKLNCHYKVWMIIFQKWYQSNKDARRKIFQLLMHSHFPLIEFLSWSWQYNWKCNKEQVIECKILPTNLETIQHLMKLWYTHANTHELYSTFQNSSISLLVLNIQVTR